jgi:hopanoid C-3 methylase HpnR
MYTRVYLRLEPLGLELVAAAARAAGHEVRLIDLQVEAHDDYFRALEDWRPDAVCFSGNYLANVPEIIDLAKDAKALLPRCFVFVGGHSVSFIARDLLGHAEGAVDCVLKGEGEASVSVLLEAAQAGGIDRVPGAVTADGEGPPPRFVASLDEVRPARSLLRHRRKYFIGTLDPCASVELARGCPWDCTFCSAWTFYGRSYRTAAPEAVVEELARLAEPGIFIVDDVAFVHERHGLEIGEAIARRGIRKQYYLETRGDVLLRHKEVFQLWRRLGLEYMFIGVEAIDEEGLQLYRKRISLDRTFEALEFARSLGIVVAINIIADPSWDRARFATVRQWCQEIPEVVNISVTTPYPGTEIWHKEQRRLTTRDYRLFDIQHAVLPTTLPLAEFYDELVKTQQVLNRKHFGWASLRGVAGTAVRLLLRRQTNFLSMLWNFDSVFNPALQLADHARPVRYELPLPPAAGTLDPRSLYIHRPSGRRGRALDDDTEHFVDETRIGAVTHPGVDEARRAEGPAEACREK